MEFCQIDATTCAQKNDFAVGKGLELRVCVRMVPIAGLCRRGCQICEMQPINLTRRQLHLRIEMIQDSLIDAYILRTAVQMSDCVCDAIHC